jgi:hypothetical protein
MSKSTLISSIFFILTLAIYLPIANASNFSTSTEQRIFTEVANSGDFFGHAVAIDGNTMVVGSPANSKESQGSAYIFVRKGALWQQERELNATDGHNEDGFGTSVAISKNTVVVGAVGAAYVFARKNTSWQQIGKLPDSEDSKEINKNNRFGSAVAISEGTIVVGAPGKKAENDGVAYVFIMDTGTDWIVEKILVAPTSNEGSFGETVAIDGNTVVIGASGNDSQAEQPGGSAYVFTRNNFFGEPHKLKVDDNQIDDFFGRSVAIKQDNIVVSSTLGVYVFELNGINWSQQQKLSPDEGNFFENSIVVTNGNIIGVSTYKDNEIGGAYIFIRSNTGWSQWAAKLVPNEIVVGDNFGISMAISGDTIVVGTPNQSNDVDDDVGAVYSYQVLNMSKIKHLASNAQTRDFFGRSVAIDGNTVVVGATGSRNAEGESSGAVYMFAHNGTEGWHEEYRFAPQEYESTAIIESGATIYDIEADNNFGKSVAFSINRVVVGSPSNEYNAENDTIENTGAVYVFQRGDIGWQPEETLLRPSDPKVGDKFGTSVAIHENTNTIVVGAPGDNEKGENSGAVYVFVHDGVEWQKPTKITADEGMAGDRFGSAVAISGNTLVIGAPENDEKDNNAGAIYVFTYDGTNWQKEKKLTAADIQADDKFGYAVGISSNTVVIGTRPVGDHIGAAYVFIRNSTEWVEQDKLESESIDKIAFGYSVAINGDTIIVGVPEDNEKNEKSGSAYLFVRHDDNQWYKKAKLVAGDANQEEFFGRTVAIGSDAKVIGSSGWSSSEGAGGIHIFPNMPTASWPSGNYNTSNGSLLVALHCKECTNIYYTTDGSEPQQINAHQYQGTPISIANTTTLKYFSVNDFTGPTSVVSQEYVIDDEAPVINAISTDPKLQPQVPLREFSTITVTASDGESGLERLELQVVCIGDIILDQDNCTTDHKYLYLDIVTNQFTEIPTSNPVELINKRVDVSKVRFLSPKKYNIVVYAYDFAGNRSELSQPFHFDERDGTTLNIFLDKPSMLQKESLKITGKMTRLPSRGEHLENRNITLTITNPEGNKIATDPKSDLAYTVQTNNESVYTFNFIKEPEEEGSAEENEGEENPEDTSSEEEEKPGEFTADVFSQKGTYTFQVSFTGEEHLLRSKSEPQTLLVGASAGYAVLIQGRLDNNEGIEAHNKTLNRIYKALRKRGFARENIVYFNYDKAQGDKEGDIDQDGEINDIHDIPDKTAIKKFFEEQLVEKLKETPAPLYIIMVDHGLTGNFLVNGSDIVITPDDLHSWLYNLENRLGDKIQEVPRIVIIGACYSGSFISSSLSTEGKEGRVIITSAAADEVSYKGLQEQDQIRSGEFFIESLFHKLVDGKSLTISFEAATEETEVFTRGGDRGQTNLFFDEAVQHPLLDDNGDGKGSNSLSNSGDEQYIGDGQHASTLFLGVGQKFDVNSADNPAYIIDVTSTIYLKHGQNQVELFLTTHESEAFPATVEIRDPKTILHKQGGNISGQLDFQQLKLDFLDGVSGTGLGFDNPKQFKKEIIEISGEPVFEKPGRYDVFYTLRDPETLDLAPIRHSLVYKNSRDNRAPESFNLLSPLDGAETRTILIFDWTNSHDPNGITYNLLIAEDENFDRIVHQQEGLVISTAYVDESAGLRDFGGLPNPKPFYYWKVQAVDSFGAITESNTFWKFWTNNPSEGPGIYSIQVCDELFPLPRCKPVKGAIFKDEYGNELARKPGGQGLDEEMGIYIFLLDPLPKEYAFTVSAPNYVETSSTHTARVRSGQRVKNRIDLQPKNPQTCSYQYRSRCNNQISCENMAGYWWGNEGEDNECRDIPPPQCGPENLLYCRYEETCKWAGGYWSKNTELCVPNTTTIPKSAGILRFSQQSLYYEVYENIDKVTITILRSEGDDGEVSVNYSTQAGSAEEGKDYEGVQGILTWVDGDNNPQTIKVNILPDSEYEKNETVMITLSNPKGGAILGEPQQTKLLIYDDDSPPIDDGIPLPRGTLQFERSNYGVNENEGIVTANVIRTGGNNGDVWAVCSTNNGTAQAVSDYFPNFQNILAWSDGDSAPRACQVIILDDSSFEEDETLTLTLSSPMGGATLGAFETKITILNDEPKPPPPVPATLQFERADYHRFFESEGTRTVLVTRAGSSDGEVSVTCGIVDINTTSDDYTFSKQRLTWLSGDTNSKKCQVTIFDDPSPEGDETFKLILDNLQGATLGELKEVTVTILADSNDGNSGIVPPPYGKLQFETSNFSFLENDGIVSIPVTRTEGNDGEVSVTCLSSDETALANFDYVPTEQTLTWADGVSDLQNCGVEIKNDSDIEENENFKLILSNPLGGAILGNTPEQAIVTIVDVTPPPTPIGTLQFSKDEYSIKENEGFITITVNRVGGSYGEVSVKIATVDDSTAQAGIDYTFNKEILFWGDGDSNPKTFEISVVHDELVEDDEFVKLRLSDATGGVKVRDGDAVLTIVDVLYIPPEKDKGKPRFEQSRYEVKENEEKAKITVIREGGTEGNLIVDYTTVDDTAKAENDYLTTKGSLTWDNGENASKSFWVDIRDDSLVEGDETIILNLLDKTGNSSTATLTILDVEEGTLQFASPEYFVSEGGEDNTAKIMITRTNGNDGKVSVDYTTKNDGTATAKSDYLSKRGTLIWEDEDNKPKNFEIRVLDDDEVEENETVMLTLSNPKGGVKLDTQNQKSVLNILEDVIEPRPCVLQFSTLTAEVREDEAGIFIPVNCIAGEGEVSVSVSVLVNGTATEENDYTIDNKTLTWEDGNSGTQEFYISIIDDDEVENDETIILELSNPTNEATLVFPYQLELIIEDNDGHIFCPSGEEVEDSCVYERLIEKKGFYVTSIKLPKGDKEGMWGLSVKTSTGLNVGGFNAGAILKEEGGVPGFMAVYLAASESLDITAYEYSGGVSQLMVQVEHQDITTGKREVVYGPKLLAGSSSGIGFTTDILAPGFYVISVLSQTDSPRGLFGIEVNAENVTGGVNIGGWIDSSTGGNGEGFGAFYINVPQEVTLKLLFGNNYGTVGTEPLFVELYFQNEDLSRQLIWKNWE